MKKRNKRILLLSVLIFQFLGIWTLWGNFKLEITEYHISSEQIPKEFSGFRITQVSDLHNGEFCDGNSRLMELLCQTEPDIIVITGDLIDSRRTDTAVALDFVKQAMEVAPVYYVTGNHEARIAEYTELKQNLTDAGATVLENQTIRISREGEYITLVGVDDPSFQVDYLLGDAKAVMKQAIENSHNESDGYTILLSHRGVLFDVYAEAGIDLVFSGHAHGGQIRFPVIGGLVAPNQGFFPKYDSGQFTQGDTTMLVSRGIGNSIFPLRVNNPPEIIVVELQSVE